MGSESTDAKLAGAVRSAEKGLLAFIRKQIDDVEEAEDILQDTFFQLALKYNPSEPIANVTGWLYRVAKNKIIDLYRRRAVRGQEVSMDGVEGLNLMVAADEPFDQELLSVAMEEALASLPEAQRTIFIQNEIEGKTFRQISEETGIPINTLLSRKHLAVLRLRELLSEIYHELVEDE